MVILLELLISFCFHLICTVTNCLGSLRNDLAFNVFMFLHENIMKCIQRLNTDAFSLL